MSRVRLFPRPALSFVFLFVLVAAAAPVQLFAHPHVWIRYRIGFEMNRSRLDGFSEEWVFDPATTKLIEGMFDRNRNGSFEPDELAALKAGYFNNLIHFGYFTNVRINGEAKVVEKVTRFSASIVDGRVVYHFFVPLEIAATARTQKVTVTIFDPTYYTDLGFADTEGVALSAPPGADCNVTIEPDHSSKFHIMPGIPITQPPPVVLKMGVVTFRGS